ncbi:MAG: DeoR/GlpR family DNA-binding transcription regulator [Propionibacteriaceae bacterium]|jgi:DeoR/GlpR family transcriptional regulator of sugar metabolism|nr:DeoR/GlpR family DNA-binding transcription regulator [Propionibacteriaceae bacterium]
MITAQNSRRSRQEARRQEIAEAVMQEGALRLEDLATRFNVSLMTVHRDVDDLQARDILRKYRGLVTALATSVVESSVTYRVGRQAYEKATLAQAVMKHIEPGEAVFLDDSTTVRRVAPLLSQNTPLTVITYSLPLLTELRNVSGLSLVALGGTYYSWCDAFMGPMTASQIRRVRADLFIMSSSGIVDDTCFHQHQEMIEVKRAMFECAARRILLVDHTKFEKRALYELVHVQEFDLVIVDAETSAEHVSRLRSYGTNVIVADDKSTE